MKLRWSQIHPLSFFLVIVFRADVDELVSGIHKNESFWDFASLADNGHIVIFFITTTLSSYLVIYYLWFNTFIGFIVNIHIKQNIHFLAIHACLNSDVSICNNLATFCAISGLHNEHFSYIFYLYICYSVFYYCFVELGGPFKLPN